MQRISVDTSSGLAEPAIPFAFDRLVEPHLDALRVVACGIVGSHDLAGDAVQEALLCLWRLDAPPADLRGWLVRTVVHQSLHVNRARQRRAYHEDRVAVERSALCPLCASTEDENDEWRRALDAALDSLSDELRAVFLLRQRDGLDYDQIARRLAVPIGTVRSRLKRARDRLAGRLGLHASSHELAGKKRASRSSAPGGTPRSSAGTMDARTGL
jgi:RNA polymerase sigma-70 factor (ECF subfamily)